MILKGAKEICGYIGENPKVIASIARDYDLPIWRMKPAGIWRALASDLDAWLLIQRTTFLGEEIQEKLEPFRASK